MTRERVASQSSELSLPDRYQQVKNRIAAAAQRVGRNPEHIILVAVTKYAAIDQIRELVALGHADLGENKVQQLAQRSAQMDEYLLRCRELQRDSSGLMPKELRWHMIGHLQRNKVRKVLPHTRLLHSVDSLRLAEEIQVAAAKYDKPQEVLVQVNVSLEKSKGGVAPAAVLHLIEQIDTMLSIRVRGLMMMAPLTDDPETVRPVFERTQELFEGIKKTGLAGEQFNILSMGMSNDFEVAIECGANVVRVGSAIFGEPKHDPEEGE